MKIHVISTQSKDDNGKPCEYFQDLTQLSKGEQLQMLNFLRRNQSARLLKFEIVQE